MSFCIARALGAAKGPGPFFVCQKQLPYLIIPSKTFLGKKKKRTTFREHDKEKATVKNVGAALSFASQGQETGSV